jgi:hypothetical protein
VRLWDQEILDLGKKHKCRIGNLERSDNARGYLNGLGWSRVIDRGAAPGRKKSGIS